MEQAQRRMANAVGRLAAHEQHSKLLPLKYYLHLPQLYSFALFHIHQPLGEDAQFFLKHFIFFITFFNVGSYQFSAGLEAKKIVTCKKYLPVLMNMAY